MVYPFSEPHDRQGPLESQVDDGSAGLLQLPWRVKATGEEGAVMLEASPAPAAETATVLVVDDEPFVAMLITDVVEELGYAWIDAANATAALEALRSDRRIDLLVTDIGLPGGMNGRQLAAAARALRPDLKVLFVTGYAHGGVLGEGPSEVGMQVISKPFAIEALESRIRDMLPAP
jgi:CheY-like chemotaxis protein